MTERLSLVSAASETATAIMARARKNAKDNFMMLWMWWRLSKLQGFSGGKYVLLVDLVPG